MGFRIDLLDSTELPTGRGCVGEGVREESGQSSKFIQTVGRLGNDKDTPRVGDSCELPKSKPHRS